MVLWGLLAALCAVLVLFTITPTAWPTKDARGLKLRDSMTVLEQKGPLLIGRHGHNGPLYNIDFGDDDGVFIYVPLLSRLFGVGDPEKMLQYLYVALISLTAAVYPTIFYRLTRSTLAALAAPLIFLVCILSMGFIDVYWIPSWAALTFFPLIYLLARDWPRFGLIAAAGITLVASWISSIRSYSGLGIAVAVALVLLLRHWRWWRLLPALIMLAVIYISINTFVVSPIRANRDHRLGSAAKTFHFTSGHTLWHTAYAGFGYLPNKYGIRYVDGVPLARVEREAPGTPFLSSRYEEVIREAYFRLVRDHPGEAIRQYAAKTLVVITDVFPYLLIAVMVLPAMLLLGPEKQMVRRWGLLTIPATIVGFLPTMVALPTLSFEQNLYGMIGLAGIMGLCWMLKSMESTARARGGLRPMLATVTVSWSALARSPAPGWRSIRISIVTIIVLVAMTFGGYYVRRESIRWQGGGNGVLMEHIRL